MEEHIYPKKINGKIYYYLQSTYRKKKDSKDEALGKGPNSGKSEVCTFSKYLGSAKSIMKKLEESKSKCIEVQYHDFGLVSTAYQVAKKIGLINVLKENIKGDRFGIPRYLFFLLAILNRVDNPRSKEKMGAWAKKTILPQLLNFDSRKLNSKTFWYVTDDILSEKELQEKRLNSNDEEDIFVHLDDSILTKIEMQVFENILNEFNIKPSCFFYDTTNFFTYIQTKTSSQSKYAQTGHNKEGRHYLKQVGLALAVESEYGFPFYHRIYRGNSHDSSTFSHIIDDLVKQVNNTIGDSKNRTIILDKGNNSQNNFKNLSGKLKWIGSLIPSNYKKLQKLDLTNYNKVWNGLKYFSRKRNVMGVDCTLVMTYSDKLFRKQEYSLNNGIVKCKKSISKKISEYKKAPRNIIPQGIISLKNKSHYGKFINLNIQNGVLLFDLDNKKIEEEKVKMGKNLLFTNDLKISEIEIIDKYKNKDAVEKGFNLLKDPDMIRQRPIRHWTDTKIRAYCFTCVSALLIIKIMHMMVKTSGIEMSSNIIKTELQDLKRVRMIYKNLETETILSHKSTIQNKLYELFNLNEIEKNLTIHS